MFLCNLKKYAEMKKRVYIMHFISDLRNTLDMFKQFMISILQFGIIFSGQFQIRKHQRHSLSRTIE